MKISCQQKLLSHGLGIVNRTATKTRTTHIMTQNVLLEAQGSNLTLSCTDLETCITVSMQSEVEEQGSIAVAADPLTDFVRCTNGESLKLTVPRRTPVLMVTSEFERATFQGTSKDQFPTILMVEEGISTRVDPNGLRQAISRVIFTVDPQHQTPALRGVYFELEDDRLILAAADGVRLAVNDGRLIQPVLKPTHFIVPLKALKELSSLLGSQTHPVDIAVSPRHDRVLFRLEDIDLISQLFSASFPNYKQQIPDRYQTRIVMDSQIFHNIIETASIFASRGRDKDIVRLTWASSERSDSAQMTIEALGEELGQYTRKTNAIVEGGDGRIALNCQHLLDVLSTVDQGNVVLGVTEPLMVSVIMLEEDKGYSYIMSPLNVHW
jgi:DNA polymerase-3 subunit beta